MRFKYWSDIKLCLIFHKKTKYESRRNYFKFNLDWKTSKNSHFFKFCSLFYCVLISIARINVMFLQKVLDDIRKLLEKNEIELANTALHTYDQNYAERDWNYWNLRIKIIDCQLSSTITKCSNESPYEQNLTDARNLLFGFDQCLYKIVKSCSFPGIEPNLITKGLNNFIGKLFLHFVSLLFVQLNAQIDRDEIMKTALPLLFFNYNFGSLDTLDADGYFRVSQVANTLISCVTNGEENHQTQWSNEDEILDDTRSIISHPEWRKNIFFRTFITEEHRNAILSSFLVNSKVLNGDHFVKWPNNIDILLYDLKAQEFKPESLAHLVYLALCFENQTRFQSAVKRIRIDLDFKLVVFKKLNYFAHDLSNCSAETTSQLDVEAFLHASAIEAKRRVNVKTNGFMLPFANIALQLCTAKQSDWWANVVQVSMMTNGMNIFFEFHGAYF